jgi:hypothetical protein
VIDEDSGEKIRRVVGFRDVAVFDVSQTTPLPDCEPLPLSPPLATVTGDSHAAFIAPLEAFAGQIGYPLAYEALGAGLHGYCDHKAMRIVVDEKRAPNGRLLVGTHEVAHALVELEDERLPRAEEELVVETVAFVVCAGVGLDVSEEAVPYVASWGESGALERVRQVAGLVDRLARRIETALQAGTTTGREGEVLIAAA